MGAIREIPFLLKLTAIPLLVLCTGQILHLAAERAQDHRAAPLEHRFLRGFVEHLATECGSVVPYYSLLTFNSTPCSAMSLHDFWTSIWSLVSK